ncbi:MAG: hypothetical protein O3B84_06590 [Chloroflexi bacterium]|nr:hypothetical protein [Chloroflexota bacterium]
MPAEWKLDDDPVDEPQLTEEDSDEGAAAKAETDDEKQEASDAPPELEQRFADFEKRFAEQNTDLKRSIGRAQSMLAKLEQQPNNQAAQEALVDRVVEISDALGHFAESVDEEILPEALRAQFRSVKQRADAIREERKLTEVKRQITEEMRPKQTAAPQGAAGQLEAQLVEEIKDHGLDPDDADAFDWKKATLLLQTDGERAVKTYIRQQIKATVSEGAAAERRQTLKRTASKSPRNGGGTPTAPEEVMGDLNRPFAERMNAAKELGMRV